MENNTHKSVLNSRQYNISKATGFRVVNNYLKKRGVTMPNKKRIMEVFSEFKIFDRDKFFMFPCYDEDFNCIGGKIRRTDNKPISEKLKSKAVSGMSTGLIYNPKHIHKAKAVILVEGETDYIAARSLGIKEVIGNLCGAAGGRKIIKELVEDKKVFVFYDNDNAGKTGAQKLANDLDQDVYKIFFPIEIEGDDLFDLWANGLTESKFRSMISGAKVIKKEEKEEKKTSSKDWENVQIEDFYDMPIEKVLDLEGLRHQRNRASCPFCESTNEDVLSFNGALFNCYTCGENGNVFKFVQKLKGWGNKEVIEYLKKNS